MLFFCLPSSSKLSLAAEQTNKNFQDLLPPGLLEHLQRPATSDPHRYKNIDNIFETEERIEYFHEENTDNIHTVCKSGLSAERKLKEIANILSDTLPRIRRLKEVQAREISRANEYDDFCTYNKMTRR